MAGALPTFFGAEAQYPVVKTVSFLTSITTSRNGTEQRRMVRPPLARFQLRYHGTQYTDMIAFQTHFLSNGGSNGSLNDFTLFGTTYHNLYYDMDQIMFDRDTLSYGFQLTLVQQMPMTTSYGTPMVNSSSSGWQPPLQIPYSRGYMFRVNKVVQPSGPKYSYGVYGTGIRNYPTGPFGIWDLKFPIATTTDAAAIETAFIKQRGRLLTFSMQDPETYGQVATFFQNCRFDTDDLVQTYLADGAVSLNLSVRTVTA